MKRHTLHAIMLLILVIMVGWIPTARADDTSQQATEIRKWAVDRMIMWAKPGITLLPSAVETLEDGKVRYGLIADAVLRTVAKNKSIFGGKRGRIRTAALILSISMFESSFRKDVDLNLGSEGRGDGGRSWCLMQVQLGSPIYVDDLGKRVNMIQTCKQVPIPNSSQLMNKCEYNPPPGAKASTPSRIVLDGDSYEITFDQTRGHSGQDLIADRELCFTAGLRIVRNSFNACGKLPMLERLSAYASGNCNDGHEASKRRVGTAVRWMSETPSPLDDVQLVKVFTDPTNTDLSTPIVTDEHGQPGPMSSFGPKNSSRSISRSLALLP